MNHRQGWHRRSGGTILHLGAVLLLGLISACGYHFVGEADPTRIDPGLRTVFVETFGNKTSEALAENIFRTAMIGRFVQEGRFKLARSRGEADLICRGSVRSMQIFPLSYKATNLAAEERLSVTLEIAFEERQNGRVIWEERGFVGTADYAVTAAGLTEASRRNAIVKLANDTAERAYRLLMSGF